MMKKDNEFISELFAVPINLYPVGDLFGITLYSSNDLKEKFKEVFKDIKRANKIEKYISKLVDNGIIVPCFSTKSIGAIILKKIIKKLFYKGSPKLLAFFEGNENKIFILIDNTSNFFGVSTNEQIVEYTIHELIHMMADELGAKEFLSHFGRYLYTFYENLFYHDFNLDEKKNYKNTIKEIVNLMVENESLLWKTDVFNKNIDALRKLKKYSKDDPETFERKILRYQHFSFQTLHNTDPRVFGKLFEHYFNIIENSYEKIIKKNIQSKVSFFYQELFVPSEVICVFSELMDIDELPLALRKLFIKFK